MHFFTWGFQTDIPFYCITAIFPRHDKYNLNNENERLSYVFFIVLPR